MTLPSASGRSQLFVIDPIERLNPARDSSVALMQAAQRLYQRLGFDRWTALDASFGRTRPVQVLGYRMLFEDTDSESA